MTSMMTWMDRTTSSTLAWAPAIRGPYNKGTYYYDIGMIVEQKPTVFRFPVITAALTLD